MFRSVIPLTLVALALSVLSLASCAGEPDAAPVLETPAPGGSVQASPALTANPTATPWPTFVPVTPVAAVASPTEVPAPTLALRRPTSTRPPLQPAQLPAPTLVLPALREAPARPMTRSEGTVMSGASANQAMLHRGGPSYGPVPPATGGTANPNDAPFPLVYFQGHGVNPFVDADEDPLSTFSLDGDTASFDVGRLYLEAGHLPPPDSVRVEEWLNAFDHGYDRPTGAPALHLDGGPSLFGPDGYWMVRVGVVPPLPSRDRPPVSVIFVLDTSGSMASDNRIRTATSVIRELAASLRPTDRVGLVLYGSNSLVSLPVVDAPQAVESLAQLSELTPSGSTFVEAGISDAYELAALERSASPSRSVRIILLSDGVGNVGRTGPGSILATIDDGVIRSVSLSTIGVGATGNYNDVMLEVLANRGNGTYHYLSNWDRAASFVADYGATLLSEVVRDARVQVEFNPAMVRKYRLLGYENRAVADDDFLDDSLDFGEIGFVRSVVALYEVRPHEDAPPTGRVVTARLRWLDPDTLAPSGVEVSLPRAALGTLRGDLSDYALRDQLVAELAELARLSFWAQCSSPSAVSEIADSRPLSALPAGDLFASTLGALTPVLVEYCNP